MPEEADEGLSETGDSQGDSHRAGTVTELSFSCGRLELRGVLRKVPYDGARTDDAVDWAEFAEF